MRIFLRLILAIVLWPAAAFSQLLPGETNVVGFPGEAYLSSTGDVIGLGTAFFGAINATNSSTIGLNLMLTNPPAGTANTIFIQCGGTTGGNIVWVSGGTNVWAIRQQGTGVKAFQFQDSGGNDWMTVSNAPFDTVQFLGEIGALAGFFTNALTNSGIYYADNSGTITQVIDQSGNLTTPSLNADSGAFTASASGIAGNLAFVQTGNFTVAAGGSTPGLTALNGVTAHGITNDGVLVSSNLFGFTNASGGFSAGQLIVDDAVPEVTVITTTNLTFAPLVNVNLSAPAQCVVVISNSSSGSSNLQITVPSSYGPHATNSSDLFIVTNVAVFRFLPLPAINQTNVYYDPRF